MVALVSRKRAMPPKQVRRTTVCLTRFDSVATALLSLNFPRSRVDIPVDKRRRKQKLDPQSDEVIPYH
jgi:hypothetical protein